MSEMAEDWELRQHFADALSQEIPSWAARTARLVSTSGTGCAGFVVIDHPTDDRSEWRIDPSLFGEGNDDADRTDGILSETELWGSDVVCLDRHVVDTPSHLLSLVMVVLESASLGCRGARWRLATRIVESAHPWVEQRAAGGQTEFTRLLPLFRWVRWRLLSEPFRDMGTNRSGYLAGDQRPCGVAYTKESDTDPCGPLAYAGGTFPGCRSLRRRARHARSEWSDTLLTYQDHPVLARIKVEQEGRLLVFVDEKRTAVLDFGDRDPSTGTRPAIDDYFDSWFSREFFSRRFMVRDMWSSVRQRLKWTVMVLFLLAVFFATLIAVWPNGQLNPLRWQWVAGDPPNVVFILGMSMLLLAMGFLIWGLTRPDGGEQFAYPFLLRFAAGTVIGSAAIVAMRGVWITRFSRPSLVLPNDCPQNVPPSSWGIALALLGGLVVVGLAYLVVEVRIHGTSGRTVLYRAGGVWLIGLGWALVIAAIDLVLIGPTFTECFPTDLFGLGRVVAYLAIALASLDLGIFFQVLWEDRPVTYPLGALRFSRRG